MGLGAKNQNDADVCTLAEILKEEDDDEDEESKEKEEEKKRKIGIMIMKPKLLMRYKNKLSMNFSNIKFFSTFRLSPPVPI